MTTQQAAECGQLIAFAQNQRAEVREMDKAGALANQPGMQQQTYVLQGHHHRNCPDDPLVVGHTLNGKTGKRFDFESEDLVAFTLKSAHRGIDNAWQYSYPHDENGVRRLMPVECLRLQAFPDDWLDLDPPLSDSAKYRLIGNAVTKNVAAWLGCRVVMALRA